VIFLLSLLPSLVTGVIDANVKGRVVAIKYKNEWRDVPDFWKDTTPLSYSKVVVLPLFLLLSFGIGKLTGRQLLMIQSLVLGIFGCQSIFYWWSMGLFRIPYIQLFEGEWRVVRPFEFPDKAPWLSLLLPLQLLAVFVDKNNEITRRVVYTGVLVALIINFGMEMYNHFFRR